MMSLQTQISFPFHPLQYPPKPPKRLAFIYYSPAQQPVSTSITIHSILQLPPLISPFFSLLKHSTTPSTYPSSSTMSGPQCCDNPPTLNPSSGAGHVEEIGGLSSYVTGSLDSKLAVLLVSDVFGYEAPLLRKQADFVAAAGFYVVVPDFLHGEPYNPDNAERPIMEWIKDHGADKGYEEAKPVIEALRQKGVSKIGAAGYCWGAKVVVQLAQGDYIQAAVLLHPSFVTLDEIKGVKAPISILGAETDHISPPALVKQFEEALNAKPEVDSFVKIFPGVVHGWTVRYNPEDPAAVKPAEEAHRDMLGWFTKHVK